VNLRRSNNGVTLGRLESLALTGMGRGVLNQESFHMMISLERKRSERSRKPFLLTLVDTGTCLPSDRNGKELNTILSALNLGNRETEVTGWYKNDSVVGVMFTEIPAQDKHSIVSTMLARVSSTLRNNLSSEQFSQISISFHLFPEDWEHELSRRPSNPTLYPDLSRRDEGRRFPVIMKRGMDILGSILALALFSPLFVLITIAITMSSKGPVFFRQERIGQYGRPFIFLKFRSMFMDNDTGVHQEWFRRFVSGQAERHPINGNGHGIYKLTNDSRITGIGRFLRRTSLDELPQFINVLRGEMSLVGPRPPIAYEVQAYQTWHRGRILEAKPGITGLWQVNGRSRVSFDEMVRLDLRYARGWSLWLDVQILLQTPRAVLGGEGAY
jgi:lipopolysaccharide/colanic/teichoic acid biosynthesis glycosyltransferase